MIIAAETGSGKTHGYLVPLIENLSSNLDPCKGIDVSEESLRKHKTYLVLCPNVMLCEQVAEMANCLLTDSGEPVVKVATVCGRKVSIHALILMIHNSKLLTVYSLITTDQFLDHLYINS